MGVHMCGGKMETSNIFLLIFFFSKTLLLNPKIIDSATLASQIDPRIPCLCLTFQELQELGGPSFHMHP